MTESNIISALANLGGTGVMVYVLWQLLAKVLERQNVETARIVDALLGVIQTNTAAMTNVEGAVRGLPEVVQRVAERLERGEGESINHERRLRLLEEDHA